MYTSSADLLLALKMASMYDSAEKESFKWTNEYVIIFCKICIKYIQNSGRGFMKWKEIKYEFQDIAKCSISHKSLKNKWDSMKKEWRVWKFLMCDGTDLGRDPSSRKLTCSNEWWDKKTKENPEAKKFRNKYLDPIIEDLWSKLFDAKHAIGNGYVTPTMDPQPVQLVNTDEGKEESENAEKRLCREGHENNDHHDSVCSEGSEYSSQLGDLDLKDSFHFPRNFTNEVNYFNGTTQVPPYQGTSTQCLDPDPIRMRFKRRQEPRDIEKRRCGQIDTLVANSTKALRILTSEGNLRSSISSSTGSSVASAMSIVNRMVRDGVIEKCGDLWCFAVCLLEDEVRRELFLNMEDDTSRKAWLVYVHEKSK